METVGEYYRKQGVKVKKADQSKFLCDVTKTEGGATLPEGHQVTLLDARRAALIGAIDLCTTAPSRLSKPSAVSRVWGSSSMGRGVPVTDLPVSWQHPTVFGPFLKGSRGGTQNPPSRKSMCVAHKLCEEMCKMYATEEKREEALYPIIDELLKDTPFHRQKRTWLSAEIEGRRVNQSYADATISLKDCASMPRGEVPLVIIEVKNEVHSSGYGYEQASVYYRNEFIRHPFKDLWDMPTFIVSVEGPQVTIGGAVFRQGLVVTKFDSVYTGINREPVLVLRVAAMLDSLVSAITTLAAESVPRYEVKVDDDDADYDNKVDAANTLLLSCKIAAAFPKPVLQDEVFYAQMAKKQQVFRSRVRDTRYVVKYTHHYNEETHKTFVTGEYAVKLIKVTHFPDVHLKVIHMEDVSFSGYETLEAKLLKLTDTRDKETLCVSLQQWFVSLMEFCATSNVVYLDLRPPNLMVKGNGDGFLLIDFELCGPVGAPIPPTFQFNPKIAWPRGVVDGTVTTYSLDQMQHMFDTLVLPRFLAGI